jgi:hypothetical protein
MTTRCSGFPRRGPAVHETFASAGHRKEQFTREVEEDTAMQARRGLITYAIGAAVAIALTLTSSASAAQNKTSTPFAGPKANTGTVTLSTNGRSLVLTLSDDFKAPDAPDPHWQVVDSKGRVYLLQKLTVKGLVGDKMNRTITLPAYVSDVAKVQFWCAYAEVVLGEASFGPANSTH